MTTPETRIVLAKLLPAGFTSDFLDGNLYLNTNSFFGKIDKTDVVRHDPHDGIDQSRQVQEIAILDDDGNWLPILGLINPVTSRYAESANLNVLCLYMIGDQESFHFDRRNRKFGDVAVVISNLREFIHRVKSAAIAKEKQVAHGPIQYISRDLHDGPMGPFRKFEKHSYQNEFRFVFDNGNASACRLQIGDIRDIAFPMASTEIPGFRLAMLSKDA